MSQLLLATSSLCQELPGSSFESLCSSAASELGLATPLVERVSLALGPCGELPAEAAKHVLWPNVYSIFMDAPDGLWYPTLDALTNEGTPQ
jgi:hypothetical protein